MFETIRESDLVLLLISDAAQAELYRDVFAAMKPGAVFVNAARGGLVVQEDLLAAIDDGHLLGAGLDVTDPEPLPPDHPLLSHPSVFVTPHVAAATDEAKLGNFMGAYEGVQAILDGRRPGNLVNPEVWDRVATRIRRLA